MSASYPAATNGISERVRLAWRQGTEETGQRLQTSGGLRSLRSWGRKIVVSTSGESALAPAQDRTSTAR